MGTACTDETLGRLGASTDACGSVRPKVLGRPPTDERAHVHDFSVESALNFGRGTLVACIGRAKWGGGGMPLDAVGCDWGVEHAPDHVAMQSRRREASFVRTHAGYPVIVASVVVVVLGV